MMQKLELQHKRRDLITESRDVNISTHRRLEIQRQLSETNAELKRINSADAERARREAEERKTRGRAEQAQNLARAAENRCDSKGAPAKSGVESPPGKMTRGEFLLKNANQMMRKIESINNPLPFTVDLYNALVAYVAQQRVHVRDYAERRVSESDDAWKQTWTEPPSGSAT